MTRVSLLFVALIALAGVRSGAYAQAPIEDELIIQTPISQFIIDAAFQEFVQYAKEKWNLRLKTKALRPPHSPPSG